MQVSVGAYRCTSLETKISSCSIYEPGIHASRSLTCIVLRAIVHSGYPSNAAGGRYDAATQDGIQAGFDAAVQLKATDDEERHSSAQKVDDHIDGLRRALAWHVKGSQRSVRSPLASFVLLE